MSLPEDGRDADAGTQAVRRFANAEDLAAALAICVVQALRQGIEQRGEASLVVSGGSTPRPFFARLRVADLAWERVVVALADERWVPADDADSNEGMVRRELLAEAAGRARFVALKTDHPTPEQGEAECAQRLAPLSAPRDAVVLGMGSDGHTASLFPGAASLATALDPRLQRPCCAVRPVTARHPRMTLTLAWLLATRRMFLHITGEKKLAVYEEALLPGPAEALPIRAVLHQEHTAVETFWAP